MSNSFSSGVSTDFQSDVLNNSFSQAPKENFSNSLDEVKIFDDFDLGKVDPLPLSYPQYSRASFLSSWHEVKRLFDEDGDMLFAASLEGSSVSSPAENDTPFPLKLSFRNNGDGSPSWAFQQFTSEHPEFQTRLKTRLEDILQTKISLSLHRYTPSKEELAAQNKKLSAYEIDLEKNTHLQALKRLFNVELIGTRKIAPDLRIQQMPEE